MALNALRTEMVTFTGTPGVEINGVIIGYKAEYSLRTGTEAKYNAIEGRTSDVASDANHKGQYYIQLGEQLYDGKLRLTNSTDPFGRPSRDWEFNGKTIGVYAKRELIRGTYTAKVTGKDLYDLLTKPTIEDKDYDFYIYVDGEDRYNATDGVDGVNEVFNTTQMNKNNKAGVGGTANGVLTEVYVDSDKKEVTIAIINTYLARAKTDYNEKQDEVTFNVYGIDRGVDSEGTVYFWKNVNRSSDQKEPITVYGEDFAITNVSENDAYLVTVAEGEIQTMAPSEILSGVTLSAFGKNDYVVTEGTQYDYAVTAQYDVEVLDEYTGSSATNLKDLKYNVYLDKYGYLIGVDLVDDANNYVFITGVDSKTSNLAAKNYEANAIFLDGTMKTITFNTEKSKLSTTSVVARGTKTANDWALANTWCTYTVNNDGVYTLTQVALPATVAGSANDAENKSVNYGIGDSTVGLRTSSGNSITKIGQYWDQHDDNIAPADGKDSTSGEINVKRVSLRGSEGTAGVRNDFKFVYGNKNTVYLNTEVKGIYTGAGKTDPRGVINKVTSVTTGVENANLEVLTESAAAAQAHDKSNAKGVTPDANSTAYGSYVLYGRDGYVIAAVTVARDASAAENLVYVDSSSVKREEDNGGSAKASGDGLWTWYRDAIKDGERVTLTEVGDDLSILKSLEKNNWYVISYNADGEVIGATHAMDDFDMAKNYTDSDLTLEKTMVDAGSKTVLYERARYNGLTGTTPDNCVGGHAPKDIKSNKGPVLKGNTFYSETEDKTGFYVDESVKVVIIQTNRNESTTQFLSGMSALENVVAKLNKENDLNNDGCGSDYHYEVSAIIENGRGKVVIINDLHKTGDSGNHDVNGAYELRLYGNLFTADDKTTGKSDAVVTVNGGEVKPTGTGTDKSGIGFGAYTAYKINSGDHVAITDWDITTGFDLLTNLDDLGIAYTVRTSARTISFIMPAESIWIEGNDAVVKENIKADVDDPGKTLDNINVTFDGDKKDGQNLGEKQRGDIVTLTFSNKPVRSVNLVEGETYTVTVGAYKDKIASVVKDGVLTINYALTAQDIYNGEVTVWKIEEGDTTSGKPVDPVDPSKPIKTVAITGVTLPVKVGDKLVDPTVKITGVDVTAKWQAATAAEKNTLTITVKAQTGYTLDKDYTVTVNGKAATKGTGDTWTFEATATKDEDPSNDPEEFSAEVKFDTTTQKDKFVVYKFDKDGNAVTDDVDKIAAALTEAAKAAGMDVTFVGKDVNNTAHTAVGSDGVTYAYDAAVQIYSITYPGGTKYAANGATVILDKITDGVTALLSGTPNMATTGVDVDTANHTATVTGTGANVTYTPAVKVGTGIASGAIKGTDADSASEYFTATLDINGNGIVTSSEVLATGSTNYVRVGTEIVLAQHGNLQATAGTGKTVVPVGGKVTLVVNGKDSLVFTMGSDGKITPDTTNKFTVSDGNSAASNTLTLSGKKSDPSYDVYLGAGTANKLPVTNGNVLVTGLNNTKVVAWDGAKYVDVTGSETDGSQALIPVSSLTTYADEGTTNIHLYRAYNVVSKGEKTDTTTFTWVAYRTYKDNALSDDIAKTVGWFFPIPEDAKAGESNTIYVEYKAGVLPGLAGTTISPLTAVAGHDVDVTATNKGIFTLTVDRNITADSFEDLVTLTGTYTADVAGDIPASGDSTAKEITGISFKEGVTGALTGFDKGDNSDLATATVTPKVALKSAKTALEFTVNTGVAITRPASGAGAIDDIGTMTITLTAGGKTIRIGVAITISETP